MNKPKPITLPAYVSEMAQLESLKIDVPFAKGVNVAELTEGDKDPLFVIVEAVTEGESRNKRFYDLETLKSIAEQINEMKPDAYDGHMKDEDRPYKRPQSKTLWVGAKIFNIDGKHRLFVKGYVMPYADDLKTYLKAAKAVGKNVAVSIFGQANEILDKLNNVKKVKDFVLESIDWARAGSAGMRTLGYMSLASEMVDENETPVPNQEWLNVIETYENLKTNVEVSVKEMYVSPELKTVAEMLDVEPSLVPQTISEMVETIKKQETDLSNNYIDSELNATQLPKQAKDFVKTLIVAEMKSGAYNRDRAKQVIAEILNSNVVKELVQNLSRTLEINPLDANPSVYARKYTSVQ